MSYLILIIFIAAILINYTQILAKLGSLQQKFDTGFTNVNKRLDKLAKELCNVLSDDIVRVLSEQLHDIKTEVSIVKSSVGNHEVDIKYLKKVK